MTLYPTPDERRARVLALAREAHDLAQAAHRAARNASEAAADAHLPEELQHDLGLVIGVMSVAHYATGLVFLRLEKVPADTEVSRG